MRLLMTLVPVAIVIGAVIFLVIAEIAMRREAALTRMQLRSANTAIANAIARLNLVSQSDLLNEANILVNDARNTLVTYDTDIKEIY